jgi:hypothetical protein
VRSETDNPCLYPAVVKVRGIPFCEPCAREQEAYFAIGELTEAPEGLREEPLLELLIRMRRTTRRRRVHADEPAQMNPIRPKVSPRPYSKDPGTSS